MHTDGLASCTAANGEDSLVLKCLEAAVVKECMVALDKRPSRRRRVASLFLCLPTSRESKSSLSSSGRIDGLCPRTFATRIEARRNTYLMAVPVRRRGRSGIASFGPRCGTRRTFGIDGQVPWLMTTIHFRLSLPCETRLVIV